MGRCKKKYFNNVYIIIPLLLILWAGEACSQESYAVHASSFKAQAQAQADAEKLKSQGYQSFVTETNIPGSGKWYRVYVGKFDTKQKAAAVADDMKSKKLIDKIFIHNLPRSKPAEKSSRALSSMSEKLKDEEPKKVTTNGPVYGNTDTKRYHLPGMPFYNKIKKHHRIVFQTEQEAIDKGYYKAGTTRDVAKKNEKSGGKAGSQIEASIRKDAQGAQNAENKQTAGGTQAITSVVEQLKKAREKLIKKDKTAQKAEQEPQPSMPTLPPPPITDLEKDKEDEFVEPDEKDIIEPVSDSPIYNKALSELKSRKYQQALLTFKEYISRSDTPKEWGQRALRHMADAHFWLGKAGNKDELMIAAEFYKNTLENFPDPRKENALTYYRLAKTYELMKYYPGAVGQYQSLIKKYPESPLVPEASYKIGEIYYTDGKYAQAEESLLNYLMKYRGRANAKKSYYMIAHAYYKDKQIGNADLWFRDAQKKWSSFKGVPKDILVDLGIHKMNLRRYDEAISSLSYYANIYPGGDKIKQVLWLLADAYRLNGQISSALIVHDRIIEKYPDEKDVSESRIKMADLGIEKPGVKVFRAISSMDNYKFPMDTYNDIIMKYATGDLAEQAMLQKAAALVKKDQKRKAADVYLEFLSLFPESRRINEASRGLKSAASAIIDDYYAKKDYLAVAYVYFRSFGAVPLQEDEYPQVQKIASSLKELSFIEDYKNILQKYLAVARDEQIINKVSVDIAEGMIAQGKFDDAEKSLLSLLNKPAVKKSSLTITIRKNLADIAYKREQYAQAVANYEDVVKSGQELQNPGKIYTRFAHSLKEQKENKQALQNYLTAVKYLSAEKREKGNVGIAYSEIGDLYVKGDNLDLGVSMYNKAMENSATPDMKLWSQFLLGNTYLRLNKDQQAQNMFAQIKTAAGPESFWSKVVDFYTVDSQWWGKYGGMIKK